jgi:integrase
MFPGRSTDPHTEVEHMARQAKVWSWRTGPRGARVTVREVTTGGNVSLFAYDRALRGARKRSLGFPVRDADGALIAEHVARAKSEATALSSRLIRGGHPAAQVTLGVALELFEREVLAAQTTRHRADTRVEIDLWRAFLGGGFVLARLGTREWNAFTRERASGEIDGAGQRVADPEKRRAVGPRTVAKSLKVLRHLCRFAANYRTGVGAFLLEGDPTRGLPLPVELNPRRPLADAARAAALLAVADRVRMAAADGKRVRSHFRELLTLARHTGRRISAILNLRWSDWRPEAKPHGALFWRAAHDKAGRDWLTPVRPEVRDALEALRRERPALGDVLLFPSADDAATPIDQHLATRWLRQAEKLAGLEPMRGGAWHPFRREWATSRKELSLKDVAEAGGWRDTTTLLKCYTQPDAETVAAVVLYDRPARVAAR